jgi:hypothetical protein
LKLKITFDEEIERALIRSSYALQRIARYLDQPFPTEVQISQEGKTVMGQILGIKPGSTGNFTASVVAPAGAVFPPGSVLTFTTDDPNAVPGNQSADGLTTDVVVAATDAQGSAPAGQPPSFNLTFTGTPPPGSLVAPVSVTVNVPIIVTPPPAFPTQVAITQNS